jgi:type I restriction enzyme S subunit
MVVRPKAQTLSKLMLKYILQALDYSDVITGAAQPQITGAGLSPCQILVPPLKEQEAIAEALSDADAAIESLDALIAKKRDVKQATMQQYAQAERVGTNARMVALGTVAVINKGELITSSTSGEGPYPVIAGGKSPAYFSSRFNRDGLTITISASGANAGYVALRKGKIWASDCSTISEDSSIDMYYLAAQLEVRQEKIYKAQFGGAQPHIRPNDLAPLEICYVPLVQQQEIGRALRAMDDELGALTEQVSKLRMVKEGMMQDLLTGKVRLV